MEATFTDFELLRIDDQNATHPFIIACKDRTAPEGEERWTVAPVSEAEAEKLYEILKKYFESK